MTSAPQSGQVVGCRLLTPLSPSTHTGHDPILASLSTRPIRRSVFCGCTRKELDKPSSNQNTSIRTYPPSSSRLCSLASDIFPRSIASYECQGPLSVGWTGKSQLLAYLSLGLPGLLIFDVFDSRSQVIQSGNFDRGVLPLRITKCEDPESQVPASRLNAPL